MDAMTWAHDEFRAASLPDARLTWRLVAVAACIRENPCGTLPQAIRGPAALKGAYRLLSHPEVSHAKIVQPHVEGTRAACAQPGEYLLIEDTTTLSFSQRGEMTGMGPLTHGYSQGLLAHTCLAARVEGWDEAFKPQAMLCGLFAQECWARQAPTGTRPERKKAKRKKATALPVPLESDRWARALHHTQGPPPGATWTLVADRECDIFEVLARCAERGADWVIRAAQDRKTTSEESVFEAAVQAPLLGSYSIALRARQGVPARKAHVQVRALSTALCAPRGITTRNAVSTWLVDVRETDADGVAEPLHWLLLTSWPCESLAKARRAIEAYSCRWLIEEYHKALKTGTKIEESQLTTAHSIEALLAIHSVIAVELLQLKLLARTRPDEPITEDTITPPMLAVLETQHRRPDRGWTNASLLSAIAQMGGYLARKHDGPPGWLSIWRGWLRLSFMAEGYLLALEQQRYG
jgi:hypothetical protein